MVRYYDVLSDQIIAITKARIKHHEKHGNGQAVMQDKKMLQIMERKKELRIK